MAVSLQQYNSLWGDETRKDINFTRLQVYFIKGWSKKFWTVVVPEFYLDYINGGMSMNVETTAAYRVSGRFIFWAKGGIGVFGDHIARYQWAMETGLRYMMFRKTGN